MMPVSFSASKGEVGSTVPTAELTFRALPPEILRFSAPRPLPVFSKYRCGDITTLSNSAPLCQRLFLRLK